MLTKVVLALAILCEAGAFTAPPAPLQRVTRLASTGTGPSLDYNPEKYKDEGSAGNFRKLSEKLADGDIERKKAEEEQLARENAVQLAREERQRKIEFMESVPDDTPAGKVSSLLPTSECWSFQA
jgi:hypothetical protein